MDIIFNVDKQSIVRTDTNLLVSDSKNYVYADFNFSSDWAGLSCFAVFTKLRTKISYTLALPAPLYRVLVPWEVLFREGDFTVTVYGGNLVTANSALVPVSPSGLRQPGSNTPTATVPVLSGNAEPADVLKPKTFYNTDYNSRRTGTLELTGDAAAGDVIKDKTFYNTNAKTKATGSLELTGDAIAGDVRAGKLFYKDDPKEQLTGTLNPIDEVDLTGDALVTQVLDGATYYKDDPEHKQTGTMPNRGAVSTDISAKATEVTIAAGYHNGSGKVKIATAEQDKIIADNIREGVTILGVAGELVEGVDTSDATATESDIVEGLTAYADGVKLTGTLVIDPHVPIFVAGTGGTIKSFKSSSLDLIATSGAYGGNINAICSDDDYVYAAGATTNKIYKYNKTTLEKVSESESYGGEIFSLMSDGNYVYAVGNTTKKIRKYLKSDMSYVAESTQPYGGPIRHLVQDANYIYSVAAVSSENYICRFSKADLTSGTYSPDYGGTIKALIVNGSYIYAVGLTNRKIRKYNLSNLTYVAESVSYGYDVYSMVISGNYIYISGYSANTIQRFNLSDLAYVDASASIGNTGYALAVYDNRIYAGDALQRIRAYDLADFELRRGSKTSGGTILCMTL